MVCAATSTTVGSAFSKPHHANLLAMTTCRKSCKVPPDILWDGSKTSFIKAATEIPPKLLYHKKKPFRSSWWVFHRNLLPLKAVGWWFSDMNWKLFRKIIHFLCSSHVEFAQTCVSSARPLIDINYIEQVEIHSFILLKNTKFSINY